MDTAVVLQPLVVSLSNHEPSHRRARMDALQGSPFDKLSVSGENNRAYLNRIGRLARPSCRSIGWDLIPYEGYGHWSQMSTTRTYSSCLPTGDAGASPM